MSATARIRVRLADTNARGCLDDGRILVFFEAGRADAMRLVGLPYGEIVERGLSALTVEARLQIHTPAYPDDVLLVETSVAHVGRVRFAFTYEIRREADAALVASGETVHICIDTVRDRPGRVPEWLRGPLDRLRAPSS